MGCLKVIDLELLLTSFLSRLAGKSKKESTAMKGKKRSLADSNEDELDTSVLYDSQVCQLKEKPFCQKHDRHCYVNPINSKHITMNIHALTLWAKKIVSLS